MGHGAVVGTNVFMEYYMEQSTPVAALAVATGWNSTGFWMFSKLDGATLILPRHIHKDNALKQ